MAGPVANVCESFHNLRGHRPLAVKNMTRAGGIAKNVHEKTQLLRSHFLLQQLSDNDIARISVAARCARFGSDESIFRRGERETDLMIIMRGRVKLSATSSNGQELLVKIVERGHMFGEIAVIDGKPRSYDATALEESEILIVRRKDLVPFLEQRPDICLRFMAALCERIRRSEALTQEAVFLHAGARLARQLLRLTESYGRKDGDAIGIDLAVSQSDLASLVGMTRESINKQLCSWRRAGIIWFKGRSYKVLKLDALRRAAESPRSLRL
jgi:CRP-like cAMP-binding protein